MGVKIYNKLNFHQHISDLYRRVSYQLCRLSRFSGILDIESKFKIFNAFIVSNVMYRLLVWHLCSVTDTRKMEKLQENALRFIYNDYDNNYKALLLLSSNDSLYVSWLKCIALEIFKILNNMSATFMNELFIKKKVYHIILEMTII